MNAITTKLYQKKQSSTKEEMTLQKIADISLFIINFTKKNKKHLENTNCFWLSHSFGLSISTKLMKRVGLNVTRKFYVSFDEPNQIVTMP